MRVPVWIPTTGLGLIAAGCATIAVATIAWLLQGGQMDAPVGTAASRSQMNAVALSLVVAVPVGTWIGAKLERRVAKRPAPGSRAASQRAVDEREALARAALWGKPWAGEAMKQRDRGRRASPRTETTWDGLNPYFCLEFDSLVRYGFTTEAEVAALRRSVQEGTPPATSIDPVILADLELLEPREAALMRVTLSSAHPSNP